ncbi:MAG TPA: hypothetical protein DC000_11855 [Clostridiales bacterium]|nr:hypothetical protein [Clostridiales bacterium]
MGVIMGNKKLFRVLKKSLVLMLVLSLMLVSFGCNKEENVPSSGTSDQTDQQKPDVKPVEPAVYTYNEYLAGSPKTWNPHEWESSTDSYIMGYTQIGLYDFKLNESRDAYEIVPEMAAEFPIDVTTEFAGNTDFGVPADAKTGYAFKIKLNEKAVWENGDIINADSYIYSMQQILNPEIKNYRASSYYSGTMTISNSEAYYKQNSPIYTNIMVDGAYRQVEDKDMKFSLTKEVVFFGDSAKSYYEGGSTAEFTDASGNDLYKKYSEKDYYDLTDEAKKDLLTIAAAFGDSNQEAYKGFCFTFDGVSPAVDWSKVGLIKTGDYEITLVLSKPITDFYLKYNLSSNWLVHEKTYEANKKQTGDIIKTSYGTSVENTISYGPYKLTEYQTDKQITMAKNENWYGYSDGKHEGQFQTTNINCQIVPTQATALQLFLQGKLDTVSLVAADMDAYRTSDYILYTPQSYTTKFTFNTDKAALKNREVAGVNKTILSYKDFRKAISLAVNRAEFAAQCTATHSAGFGLFNYNYVYKPETGDLYRNSKQAQDVLCKLYGVDSEEDITGYDKEQAAKLFTDAYNAALAAGDIKAEDKVELEFLVYNSDETYVKIINFVQEALNVATVGTPLEGKIMIKMTPDEDYYDHAQQGLFEMIMSTWGGSSMDPYGIVECYCDEETMFEYGFKPKSEELTIEVNGQAITKTFYDWYQALVNGEYAAADADTRLVVLAGIELGILETYNCTPMYYRTATSLESQKVNQGAEEYVQIVAFGGVRHLTYNYTDAEWEEYCKSQNNQLTY